MKIILRVKSNALDAEVDMLIDAAKADMIRVGVRPELVDPSSDTEIEPMVKQAIACYCKSNFGYDNEEATRFRSSYYQTVADLMNSPANVAARGDESE